MKIHIDAIKIALLLFVALAWRPAAATPVLGPELASFAVLGASTVTSTGATALTGSVGVSPGTSITGFGPATSTGTIDSNDPTASAAHAQLATAMGNLQKMGSGALIAGSLDGLTLAPGVYTVASLAFNLTQTLTLDGGGDPNAYWVFNLPTTLITATNANVKVINAGAGAGVYWVVGTSATLGTGTTFAGNILANISITMNYGVNLNCGRALALFAAVTMITDTVNSVDCTGSGVEGSAGLSGGLDVPADGSAPVALLPTGSGSGSCSLQFSVPSHLAETTQAFTVTSVTSNKSLCRALASESKVLNFKCSYANPASGTLPLRMGANVPLASTTSSACSAGGANLTLAFNASGVANATLIYADAGQMTLSASYLYGSSASSAISGSSTFIVAPAKFAFSQIRQSAAPGAVNPAAANEQGARFIKAGEAFSATVTALNSLNIPSANFGRETVPEQLSLTASLLAPSAGNLPAPTGNFGNFSGGAASASNLAWSEAGIMILTAQSSNPNGYLGSALKPVGSSGNIGRFVPDHFDTAITAGVPIACPAGLACPAAGAVYSKQAFGVTVTARNLAGNTTQNYTGALARAVTLDAWDAPGSSALHNPPAAPAGNVLSNPLVAAASFTQGVASVATPVYAFPLAFPATANLSAPSAIYLRASDTDGVTSLRDGASVEGGVTVLSGRMLVATNYGSELLALPVSVSAQYWNGSRFSNSATDNLNTFNRSNVTLSNCTKNLATGTACSGALAVAATPTVFTLKNGSATITLNAAGAGHTGTADLSIGAIAYLPSTTARVALGFYKAGPVVYFRELY